MSRRVTLNLGFQGNTRDVTVTIPDDEPTPWQWAIACPSSASRRRASMDRSKRPAPRATHTISNCPGCFTARYSAARGRTRAFAVSICRRRSILRACEQCLRSTIAKSDSPARSCSGRPISSDIAAERAQVDQSRLRAVAVRSRYGLRGQRFLRRESSAAARTSARSSIRASATSRRTGDRDEHDRGDLHYAGADACMPRNSRRSRELQPGRDQLTVWCSTQGVFSVRDDLAVYFSLPPDSVRVLCEYLGGGFGSKFGATPEMVVAARLSKATGVPVKVMLPRADEHRSTGNRPNSEQKVKMGVDRDGKLIAIDLRRVESGGIAAVRAARVHSDRSIDARISASRKVTSIPTPGRRRRCGAPGWPQGCFALDSRWTRWRGRRGSTDSSSGPQQ